ncbi:MAG: hypothetical protein SGPRY_010624, partial [Prymnesium sp.]
PPKAGRRSPSLASGLCGGSESLPLHVFHLRELPSSCAGGETLSTSATSPTQRRIDSSADQIRAAFAHLHQLAGAAEEAEGECSAIRAELGRQEGSAARASELAGRMHAELLRQADLLSRRVALLPPLSVQLERTREAPPSPSPCPAPSRHGDGTAAEQTVREWAKGNPPWLSVQGSRAEAKADAPSPPASPAAPLGVARSIETLRSVLQDSLPEPSEADSCSLSDRADKAEREDTALADRAATAGRAAMPAWRQRREGTRLRELLEMENAELQACQRMLASTRAALAHERGLAREQEEEFACSMGQMQDKLRKEMAKCQMIQVCRCLTAALLYFLDLILSS